MAGSRSEASEAIRSGKVTVSGRPAAKAGMLVAPEDAIGLARSARRFVSRGGEKLEAALDRMGVEVAGRVALDAGASTGGFTDCLLSRGAAHVIAVDVGYGQLDWRLREDPRVTVMERTNARELRPDSVPNPDVVTADLSFISLALALPSLVGVSAPEADFVLLVKPQFEAGRSHAEGGVVRDPATWHWVIGSVARVAEDLGLEVRGVMPSPLKGPAGNVEFFLYARRAGAGAHDSKRSTDRGVRLAIDRAVEEAKGLVSIHG